MNQTITPAPIRKTLEVRTAPAKAFRVFTDGFDRWWPRTHTIGKGPLRKAVLEARAGGRWYGVDEDGSETDWGKVLAWDPPRRLLLAWSIGPDWAYDPGLLTEVEVTFTDLGDGGTRVDFEHRHLERMGDRAAKAAQSLGGGWPTLLELFKTEAEKPD